VSPRHLFLPNRAFLCAYFTPKGAWKHCARVRARQLVGLPPLPQLVERGQIDRSVLSHRLRGRYDAQSVPRPISLTEADLRTYTGDTDLPKPQEQADNLILWIGSAQKTTDQWTGITLNRLAAVVGTAAGVSAEPGFAWLHAQIAREKLYDLRSAAIGPNSELRLTMAGWKHFDELSKRRVVSKTAFMAMKFEDVTLIRVLNECFKPAVKRAGFTLRPLNEKQPAGLIDNQIRAAIRSARFVVADLTHDNNGAYFEAGFAEGIGLPVIYTCEAEKFNEKKTHFDTNHMKTIPWRIDQLQKAAEELTATVRDTLPGEAVLEA
jgi:hypothetical protein